MTPAEKFISASLALWSAECHVSSMKMSYKLCCDDYACWMGSIQIETWKQEYIKTGLEPKAYFEFRKYTAKEFEALIQAKIAFNKAKRKFRYYAKKYHDSIK